MGETCSAMRPLLSMLVLLAAAVPAAAAEPLREIRHPASGQPAFRCLVPENWTSQVDAGGNLLLANRGRTANFSLAFTPSPRPREALDELAKELLDTAVTSPWDSREPAEISGYRGFKYAARVRAPNGVVVRAEVVLVAVGDQQIAVSSLLLAERVSPADEGTARLVHAAIHIAPGP